ncbi:MAG: methylated-DNA--[protein]-cysteine S-methyltransferase [Phycisphaerales bacterium]
MDALATQIFPSPLGDLLAGVDVGLAFLQFPGGRHTRPAANHAHTPAQRHLLDRVHAQLDEYFAGTRHGFNLPLAPIGTAFQQRVWAALLHIPYGTTTTYGDLARRLGTPNAARAVGAANGANPIAIIIPCHRVIDAAGRLHGYGGGLNRKQWLLEHEGSLLADPTLGHGLRGTPLSQRA